MFSHDLILSPQPREAALAKQLGCSEGQSQLACFRAATPDEFVDAALAVVAMEDDDGFVYGWSIMLNST